MPSFFFEVDGDHRDLHVLTHSFPTRRSSDLVASAIAGGMPNAGLIPAQLQATLGQDDGASSNSADGQALVVNGGPGDTVARLHFTLPARTGHGAPWAVWVARKPGERLQPAGAGRHTVAYARGSAR